MFIYDTIRYKKSYILTIIVYFLLQIKRCVVYLSNYHELAKKLENDIKLTLFLTYTDNVKKLNKISTCKIIKDIITFCELSKLLYFIVNQMNALNYHNNSITSEYYYFKSSLTNKKD